MRGGCGGGSFRAALALASLADPSGTQAQEPLGAEHRDETTTEKISTERLTAWLAPPSCITVEELRFQVQKQITSEPSVIRQVRGEMRAGPAGWIATFAVYDSDVRLGERVLQLSDDECRTHDETLALVVALLIEHGPPPPPDEEPPPTEEKESDLAQPGKPSAEPEPPQATVPENESESLRLRAGIGWRATTGWLPSLGWGPTAFFGAEVLERAAVDLVGDYYLPDKSAGFEEATVRASGGRVHVRGCGSKRWESWGASVCGGVGWIALAASGRSVSESETAVHGTVQTNLSGALEYHLGAQFGLEAGAELMAPFSRGRFVFEGPAGEILVHETRPILFTSHVGVVLTL